MNSPISKIIMIDFGRIEECSTPILEEKDERPVPDIFGKKIAFLQNKLSSLFEQSVSLKHDYENFQNIIRAQNEEISFLREQRTNIFNNICSNKEQEDELIRIKIEEETCQENLDALQDKIELHRGAINALESKKKAALFELKAQEQLMNETGVEELLPTILNTQLLEKLDKNAILTLEKTLEQSLSIVSNTKMAKERADEEIKYCCVCLERKKSVLILPCKHLCLCHHCSVTKAKHIASCPICRADVEEKISVFIPK